MNATLVAMVAVAVLVILLALEVPVGIALGLVGIAGYCIAAGLGPGLGLLAVNPFTKATSYDMSVLPLFVLMGDLVLYSGLSGKLYDLGNKWLGHLRGGLAMATVASCAAFAAMCGSTIATVATIGKVAVPQMQKYGYDNRLSAGCVAVAGTLGIMIPPSAAMVIYGYLTDTSIGKLLIAGMLPGIIMALLFAAAIYAWVRVQPSAAPLAGTRYSWKERTVALRSAWGLPLIMAIIFGGIYSGVTTATEAGAVAAFTAFVLFLMSPERSFKAFASSIVSTGRTTSMLMLIIMGAFLFGALLGYGNIPKIIAGFITGLAIPRLATFGLILLSYVVMGCFLDGMAMVVITMPIVFPVVMSMGFDPVWFGVIIVLMIEIGQVTPPFGMACFTVVATLKDIPLETVFKGIAPFLACDFIMVGLLIAFPQIALFLPGMMK